MASEPSTPPWQGPDALDDASGRHLLEAAEALGGSGSWVWYEDERRSDWSPNALRILGLRDGEERWLFDLVHPEDQHIRTYDTFVAATTPLTIEYRIVRRSDGRTLWLRETGVAVLHPDGRVARVYGSIVDITELQEALAHEREQIAIVDAIFAAAPIGIVLYDRELRYLRVNDAYAEWSGIPVADHVGRRIDDVYPGLAEQVEPIMRRILETGEPVTGVEATHGGRWYRSSRYPVTSASGEVLAIANIIDDFTEVKRLGQALETQIGLASTRLAELELMQTALTEQATTDGLTGIANRRRFSERLHDAWARARRHGTAVAVLLLDLDGFKEINDTSGHAAGDRVLVATAEVIQHVAREVDVPARLGGDEFVLLLSDLDPAVAHDAAEAVATRLRARLDEAGIAASIGTATSGSLPRGATEAAMTEGLLAAADRDMYRAKNARRLGLQSDAA